MEQYIKENVLSMTPVYTADHRTEIITGTGVYKDKRTVHWLVEKLANYFSVDVDELRKQSSDLLKQKKHVVLPINKDIILLPVKTRSAVANGESTIGYINLAGIDSIDASEGDGPWLSKINLKNGYSVDCLNTATTLREKIRQGEQCAYYFARRRSTAERKQGLCAADIMDCLPACDCILLEVFKRYLN